MSTLLDALHIDHDRALSNACLAFWLGDWSAALLTTARIAAAQGLTPEQAGYALAFAVQSLNEETTP